MALLPNNKIIIFDHTDIDPSNISLPYGKCGIDHQILKEDCWAHSIKHVEYDFDCSLKLKLEKETYGALPMLWWLITGA